MLKREVGIAEDESMALMRRIVLVSGNWSIVDPNICGWDFSPNFLW